MAKQEDFNIGQEILKAWDSDVSGDVSGDVGSDVSRDEKISVYDFIFKYCYTLDPHDKTTPIKQMPDKPHLRAIVKQWMENDLLCVVKSRQMMVSWLMCAIHLWDTMYHKGRMAFFISKNENDANFSRQLSLLSRVKFIYDHLPEELKVECKLKQKPACFEFPKMHSSIYGLSQDSEALRMYTATTVFWDEAAFHDHAHMAYAAVKPTIDGGGKMCLVSTPNGKFGLFHDLVHDSRKKKLSRDERLKTNLM